MTEKYTPEKVAELVEKLIAHRSVMPWRLYKRAADALTAVSAERDEFRTAWFARGVEIKRLEENRASWIGDAMDLVAKAEADRDRLRKAITDALAERMNMEADRILRAALDKEGQTDE